jgi:hypothetical protein
MLIVDQISAATMKFAESIDTDSADPIILLPRSKKIRNFHHAFH